MLVMVKTKQANARTDFVCLLYREISLYSLVVVKAADDTGSGETFLPSPNLSTHPKHRTAGAPQSSRGARGVRVGSDCGVIQKFDKYLVKEILNFLF